MVQTTSLRATTTPLYHHRHRQQQQANSNGTVNNNNHRGRRQDSPVAHDHLDLLARRGLVVAERIPRAKSRRADRAGALLQPERRQVSGRTVAHHHPVAPAPFGGQSAPEARERHVGHAGQNGGRAGAAAPAVGSGGELLATPRAWKTA